MRCGMEAEFSHLCMNHSGTQHSEKQTLQSKWLPKKLFPEKEAAEDTCPEHVLITSLELITRNDWERNYVTIGAVQDCNSAPYLFSFKTASEGQSMDHWLSL